MKNKSLIITVVVLILIIVGVAVASKNKTPSVGQNGSFCGPEGTLSQTAPIQSHRSYCIKSDSSGKTYGTSTPSEYTFSLVDDQGNTLKDFAVTHTKEMHVIVVRKDLAYFQHLHPQYNSTAGQFTLKDLTFPADGDYRIFADFTPSNSQMGAMGLPLGVTISEDVRVGNGYTPVLLGSEEKSKTFDGHLVTLSSNKPLVSGEEAMLVFDLRQNSKPVIDLEPYLGALGHSVILREGTLDFIHAHPTQAATSTQNGKVSFMVDFPEAGKYKIFTQFQRAGKVMTTDFVVSVVQGTSTDAPSEMNTDMPTMDHSQPSIN